MVSSHGPTVRKKYPVPFFLSATERNMITEGLDNPICGLSLVVNADTLHRAIDQVEILGSWMEERLVASNVVTDNYFILPTPNTTLPILTLAVEPFVRHLCDFHRDAFLR